SRRTAASSLSQGRALPPGKQSPKPSLRSTATKPSSRRIMTTAPRIRPNRGNLLYRKIAEREINQKRRCRTRTGSHLTSWVDDDQLLTCEDGQQKTFRRKRGRPMLWSVYRRRGSLPSCVPWLRSGRRAARNTTNVWVQLSSPRQCSRRRSVPPARAPNGTRSLR